MRINARLLGVFLRVLMGGAGLLLAIAILRSAHAGQADEIATPADRITLGQAQAGSLYAATISIKDPALLQGKEAFHVSVSDTQGSIIDKWLHSADLDFYFTFRARTSGPVIATLRGSAGTAAPPPISAAFRLVPE